MTDEDKSTLEKEYFAIVAVNEWLERIKRVWQEYIWEQIDTE